MPSIQIKTLKGGVFKVEYEDPPTSTVLDLKNKIAELHGHPVELQKLIYSGRVLKDTALLKEEGFNPDSFIVLMLSKKKAAAAAPASAAAPAAAAAPAPAAAAAPAPAASNPQRESKPADAAPAAPAASSGGDAPTTGASALVSGAAYNEMVDNLCNMGFERPQVQAAMRAAFNNPDRAVEYLMNGIPDHLAASAAAPAAPPAAAPAGGAAAPAAPAAAAGPGAAPGMASLFPAPGGGAAPAAAGGGDGDGGDGGDAGAMPELGGEGAGALEFLRQLPQFAQLRQMLQTNPQLLQPILQQIGQTNPQLLQAINENPEEFLRLLSEVGGGAGGAPGEGGALPPGTIQVTQEEKEAIERLEALGFERSLVIQAYFACDKNEELAANYLFEHAGEFDD